MNSHSRKQGSLALEERISIGVRLVPVDEQQAVKESLIRIDDAVFGRRSSREELKIASFISLVANPVSVAPNNHKVFARAISLEVERDFATLSVRRELVFIATLESELRSWLDGGRLDNHSIYSDLTVDAE